MNERPGVPTPKPEPEQPDYVPPPVKPEIDNPAKQEPEIEYNPGRIEVFPESSPDATPPEAPPEILPPDL